MQNGIACTVSGAQAKANSAAVETSGEIGHATPMAQQVTDTFVLLPVGAVVLGVRQVQTGVDAARNAVARLPSPHPTEIVFFAIGSVVYAARVTREAVHNATVSAKEGVVVGIQRATSTCVVMPTHAAIGGAVLATSKTLSVGREATYLIVGTTVYLNSASVAVGAKLSARVYNSSVLVVTSATNVCKNVFVYFPVGFSVQAASYLKEKVMQAAEKSTKAAVQLIPGVHLAAAEAARVAAGGSRSAALYTPQAWRAFGTTYLSSVTDIVESETGLNTVYFFTGVVARPARGAYQAGNHAASKIHAVTSSVTTRARQAIMSADAALRKQITLAVYVPLGAVVINKRRLTSSVVSATVLLDRSLQWTSETWVGKRSAKVWNTVLSAANGSVLSNAAVSIIDTSTAVATPAAATLMATVFFTIGVVGEAGKRMNARAKSYKESTADALQRGRNTVLQLPVFKALAPLTATDSPVASATQSVTPSKPSPWQHLLGGSSRASAAASAVAAYAEQTVRKLPMPSSEVLVFGPVGVASDFVHSSQKRMETMQHNAMEAYGSLSAYGRNMWNSVAATQSSMQGAVQQMTKRISDVAHQPTKMWYSADAEDVEEPSLITAPNANVVTVVPLVSGPQTVTVSATVTGSASAPDNSDGENDQKQPNHAGHRQYSKEAVNGVKPAMSSSSTNGVKLEQLGDQKDERAMTTINGMSTCEPSSQGSSEHDSTPLHGAKSSVSAGRDSPPFVPVSPVGVAEQRRRGHENSSTWL